MITLETAIHFSCITGKATNDTHLDHLATSFSVPKSTVLNALKESVQDILGTASKKKAYNDGYHDGKTLRKGDHSDYVDREDNDAYWKGWIKGTDERNGY